MIREAIADDVPRLLEMGERFLTETVYRDRVPINLSQMALTVTRLLDDELGAIFVSDRDGGIVGMIGVVAFTNPISGEATVGELFWWVEPEHRGHGLRLLKHAEAWARARGARKLHLVAPTPEIGRFYERLGFAPLETAYDKAIA